MVLSFLLPLFLPGQKLSAHHLSPCWLPHMAAGAHLAGRGRDFFFLLPTAFQKVAVSTARAQPGSVQRHKLCFEV